MHSLRLIWIALPITLCTRLPDKYIVTLQANVSSASHVDRLHELIKDPKTVCNVSHVYDIGNFQGYAGEFSPDMITLLRSHQHVASIKPDRTLKFDDIELRDYPPEDDAQDTCDKEDALARRSKVTQLCAGWGLFRLSHKRPVSPTAGSYIYDSSAGRGTYAYIVDSGILADHEEFGNRVAQGYNAVHDESPTDRLGHGTFVAGLIGGKTYGVAKLATLISVKVAPYQREASESLIIAGIQWATSDIISKRRQSKAVINISMTAYKDSSVNQAVDAAYAQGITVVAAAGNNDIHAGHLSPGSARALTVSAVDKDYNRWEMANWGRDVYVFAPGVAVKGAASVSKRSYAVRDGTSYAAAYVSGLVLYGKALHNLPNALATLQWIQETGVKGLVKDTKGGKNLFPYNGNGA